MPNNYVVYTKTPYGGSPGSANPLELACQMWGNLPLPDLEHWELEAAYPGGRTYSGGWTYYVAKGPIDQAVRELVETGFAVAVAPMDFSLVAWHCSFPIQTVTAMLNNEGI